MLTKPNLTSNSSILAPAIIRFITRPPTIGLFGLPLSCPWRRLGLRRSKRTHIIRTHITRMWPRTIITWARTIMINNFFRERLIILFLTPAPCNWWTLTPSWGKIRFSTSIRFSATRFVSCDGGPTVSCWQLSLYTLRWNLNWCLFLILASWNLFLRRQIGILWLLSKQSIRFAFRTWGCDETIWSLINLFRPWFNNLTAISVRIPTTIINQIFRIRTINRNFIYLLHLFALWKIIRRTNRIFRICLLSISIFISCLFSFLTEQRLTSSSTPRWRLTLLAPHKPATSPTSTKTLTRRNSSTKTSTRTTSSISTTSTSTSTSSISWKTGPPPSASPACECQSITIKSQTINIRFRHRIRKRYLRFWPKFRTWSN